MNTVFLVGHTPSIKLNRDGAIEEASRLTYRNESTFVESWALIETESYTTALEVRVYGKNANRVCLWLRNGMGSVFQGGANGYGYGRTAGAIEQVLFAAGFRNTERHDIVTSTANVPEVLFAAALLIYPDLKETAMLCVHAHG